MSDREHGRMRDLFGRALDLPGGERPAFLASECGADAGLRSRVEALLAAAADERFLAAPTGGARRDEASIAEGPGSRIGPYKLLQQIGEGGFGAVFMAEQELPVARRVALKIIKLGMDTRQVVARFEQERQALALMDHPNVARVIDAGATETGRPYFVMELVKGEPIVEYCDRHELSIGDRLSLFQQVCNAVQHAHSKGIIHRDLKPSNILVGTQDGKPLAKIIDFGIAKATSAKLTEKTLFTEHQQVIGTLQYMSPEQAEGSLDIDTRTDVYALGVVLYELLTGSTPFDARTMREAFYSEIQRMIREVDPPRPSTRLVESGETLAAIAARRRVEPKRLGTIVRGELDWIVMKALEKERARRYESAHGLAEDIRRYLAGEVVSAAPPSATYRLRKVVRRHRRAFLAGAAVAIALLCGVVAFGWAAGVARAERDRALLAQAAEREQRAVADEQRSLAEERRVEAERQQRLAEANAEAEAKARRRAESVTGFVTEALKSSDPNEGGEQDITVARAMQQSIELLDAGSFRDEPDLDAGLRKLIADILSRNGRASEALPQAERALATFTELAPSGSGEVAAALNQVATIRQELGRLEEAEPLFVRGLAMQRALHGGDHPDVSFALNNLAGLLLHQGRDAEAEPLYAESLAIKERLFPGDHPDVAMGLNNLASVVDQLGRRKEAAELFDRSLAMHERLYDAHPALAMSLHNLGQKKIAWGRLVEAQELLDRSLAMYRKLFHGDHPEVARAIGGAANARRVLGRFTEAEALALESLAMEERLFPGAHPSVARALDLLVRIRRERGDHAGAEEPAARALAMLRELYPAGHPSVGEALQALAAVLRSLDRRAEAEELLAEGLVLERQRHPGDHADVARALHSLASAVAEAGRVDEARALCEESLAMLQRLRSPDDPLVAAGFGRLGFLLLDAGRPADAEPRFREALERSRRHYGGDHYDVAVALSNLGWVLHELGRTSEEQSAFDEAIAMHRRRTPDPSLALALTLRRAGEARVADGDPEGARALMLEALAIAEPMLDPASRELAKYRAALSAADAALAR